MSLEIFTDSVKVSETNNHNEYIKTPLEINEIVIKGRNETQYLPGNLGNFYPNLQELCIHDAKLKTLKRLNFNFMALLTTLNITNNRIVEAFDEDAFNDLASLEALNLNENLIESFPPKLLHKLVKLIHFNAQKNKIQHISADFFAQNKIIQRIYLNNNKLKTIPFDFQKLNELQLLNLKDNDCINDHFLSRNESDRVQAIINVNCHSLISK